MRAVYTVASTLLLCGCASTHNLNTDGHNLLGGGYRESQVHKGIFEIYTATNWAPWVNTSGARESWRARAKELCGSEKFRELEVSEGSFDQMPAIFLVRYIVTHRHGYAVCESSGLSDDEALTFIRKR